MVPLPKHRSTIIPGMRVLALLPVPAAIFFIAIVIQRAQGPHYLGRNADPEYAYLFNSLNLALGAPPGHTDHPGTTIQLWGALVIRTVHLFAGRGEFVPDVITRSEFYLTVIYVSLAILYAITLFVVGRAAFSAFGRFPFAVLAQATLFVFPTAFYYLQRVAPELGSLMMVNLLGMALLKLTYSGDAPGLRNRWILWLGIFTGLAMVTKVTFVPVILLGLIMLSSRLERIRFAAATIGSLLVFASPTMPHWIRMARWFARLMAHSGHYGTGPKNAIQLDKYFSWIAHYLAENLLFSALLGGSLFGLFLVWRRAELRAKFKQDRRLRALGALLAFHAAMLLMVAKHPSDRYLAPTLGLMVLTGLIALDLCGSARFIDPPPLLKAGAWTVIFGLLGINTASELTRFHASLLADTRQQLLANRLSEFLWPRCLLLRCIFSSSQSYAASFGNGYSGARYSEFLTKLQPHYLGYDFFTQTSYPYNTQVAGAAPLSAKRLFDTNASIIFQSGIPEYFEKFPVRLPDGYELVSFYDCGVETFYWAGTRADLPKFRELQKSAVGFVQKERAISNRFDHGRF
jgi:hypothetical protein